PPITVTALSGLESEPLQALMEVVTARPIGAKAGPTVRVLLGSANARTFCAFFKKSGSTKEQIRVEASSAAKPRTNRPRKQRRALAAGVHHELANGGDFVHTNA
ncbi:hypothetical protein KFL_012240010, partial [Klebsormidium nitens]